ncbi:hypothetical protein V8G54_021861 [Vigna mungo]|uniref:Uncharacterized protein n=1 Tax=Vigna mungo TaxID=3915 RepID=A0AAQ3NGF4_VIGMU
MDRSKLKKLSLFDFFLHYTLLSKMIMDPILLHTSRSPGGVAHRKTKHRWKLLHKHCYQCSFAYSRRTTNYNRLLSISYHTFTPCNHLSPQIFLLLPNILGVNLPIVY